MSKENLIEMNETGKNVNCFLPEKPVE